MQFFIAQSEFSRILNYFSGPIEFGLRGVHCITQYQFYVPDIMNFPKLYRLLHLNLRIFGSKFFTFYLFLANFYHTNV